MPGYDAVATTLLQPVPPSTPLGPRGKPATRQTLIARRDAMTPAERADASERIAHATNQLLADRVSPGEVVGLYWAKGTEVDTARVDAFARSAGLTIAYPRVVDGQRGLAFHVASPSELVATRFGLREPPAGGPTIELSEISLFLMPGLAFDRIGGRVGWGLGHYDATLVAAPDALRIGLAFECQVVDRVPHDPHDIPVHIIITEVATHTVA
jgi:5-formyltetrahydrofolate cyclo-ligase